MQIVKVNKLLQDKEFWAFSNIIYKEDPNWIPHLKKDEAKIFDSKQNPFYTKGEACRWLLRDNNQKLIGRIAAFVNHDLASSNDFPVGGMGFFECIDDAGAAHLLFDTASHWLKSKGMKAMDGPINFGEKDRFWGLLTEGFGKPTPYLLNYHPPYYKELFEGYGFQNYYEQYIYNINNHTPIPSLVKRSFERLTMRGEYEFKPLELKRIDSFANDFRTIYNQAWGDVHKHFKPITEQETLQLFNSIKFAIDPDLIIFAYHQEKPIAVFIGIPELNEIFKNFKGKLHLWNKLRFLYHKWRGSFQTVYGILFGIVPEYRNKGVESGLIISIQNSIERRQKYEKMYIAWIGDFNPKMVRIVELLTKEKAFTLTTYRKMLDKDIAFERHPRI